MNDLYLIIKSKDKEWNLKSILMSTDIDKLNNSNIQQMQEKIDQIKSRDDNM
jgi:hypothetical protein